MLTKDDGTQVYYESLNDLHSDLVSAQGDIKITLLKNEDDFDPYALFGYYDTLEFDLNGCELSVNRYFMVENPTVITDSVGTGGITFSASSDGFEIYPFGNSSEKILTLKGGIYKNGIKISGSTTLADILGDGYGYYRDGALVTLTDGQTEISDSVTVQTVAFYFETNLPSESMVDQTLTVNAVSRSDKPITYQWYKGGEAISGATDPSYTPTEEGQYSCVATCDGADLTSTVCQVNTYGVMLTKDDGTQVYYETLDDLHSALYREQGKVKITLLKDSSVEFFEGYGRYDTLELDLNGYEFSVDSYFWVEKPIVITDSAGTGGITFPVRNGGFEIYPSGSLTLKGGTYKNGIEISLGDDTTLSSILGDGYGYYQDGELVTLTDGQTEISGSVTVKRTGHIHNADGTAGEGVTYDTKWDGSKGETTISTNTNIVLTDNTTFTGMLRIDSGAAVNLCLNGHTLDMGSNRIELGDNTTLNICDCGTGGRITSSNTQTIFNFRGTVNIAGGTVSGNQTIWNSGGNVNVSGGTVIGTNFGIYNYSGTVEVSGGTVTGEDYYGVYNTFGTVKVSGGTVTGSMYGINNEYGDVCLSNSPVISGNFADLYDNNGKIYGCETPPDISMTLPGYYCGQTLTVQVSGRTVGDVIIYYASPDKFTLVKMEGHLLIQGSGDNAEHLVLALLHTHAWATAWTSDGTAHWHECTASSCTITENAQKDGYETHTAPADDGDCTTAVVCPTCNYVFTAANTSHSYTNACDTDCNNPGCTAGNRVTNHIPGAAATCQSNQTCTECSVELNPQLSHSYTGEAKANGDKTHSYKCVNGCDQYGDTAACSDAAGDDNHACDICGAAEITSHTPAADDGNCTTAILCTECSAVTTPAKESHSFTDKASASLASTADCQHKATYYVQCDHCHAVSDTVTVEVGGLGAHKWDTIWSKDDDGHWHKCLVLGCNEINNETEHFSTGDNVATYTKKPVCDECGKEYGDVLPKLQVEKPAANTTVFIYNGTQQTYAVAANAAYAVTGNTRTDAGSQTVTVSLVDKDKYCWADGTNQDLTFTFTIGKATPETSFPIGLSIGTDKTLSDIVLPEGYTWDVPSTAVAYGAKEYAMTFTPADTDNYNTVKQNVTVIGNDVTAPTGKVEIGENEWTKFWNGVTFGLFFKETQTVTVTAADTESGIHKTEYYLAAAETEDFTNVQWTAFEDDFSIDPNHQYVVYVKITDKAGNAIIINSDGVVLDNISPILVGIEDGKTYHKEVTVTVTDTNLDKVEVNGQEVTVTDGVFKLSASADKQTVKAFDKAGNVSAEITVTVESEHSFLWDDWTDNEDGTHSKDAHCICGADLTITAPVDEEAVVDGLEEEAIAQGKDLKLVVETNMDNIDEATMAAIQAQLGKGVSVQYIDITIRDVNGNVNITNTTNALEIPVAFDFAGKLNIVVYRNHQGQIALLKELDVRPEKDFADGAFYLDRDNGIIYIYSNQFSTYGIAYHVHELAHVPAKEATAEADGNIEYWYCEGCDKYFKDAEAQVEIAKDDTILKYSETPATGDSANIWMWATLMFVSAISMFAILVTKKRKEETR